MNKKPNQNVPKLGTPARGRQPVKCGISAAPSDPKAALREVLRSKMNSCDCKTGRSLPEPPYKYPNEEAPKDYFKGCPMVSKKSSHVSFKSLVPCDCDLIQKIDAKKKKKKLVKRPKPRTIKDRTAGILKYLDPSFKTETPNYLESFDLPDEDLIRHELDIPAVSYKMSGDLDPRKLYSKYPVQPVKQQPLYDLSRHMKLPNTLSAQKLHAAQREKKLLQAKDSCGYRMKAPKSSFELQISSVDSPQTSKTALDNGDGIKPKPASRTPSEILPFIQQPEYLDVKHARSGIYINETGTKKRIGKSELPPPKPEHGNPRKIQAFVDKSDDEYYISDIDGEKFAIPEKYFPLPPKPFRPCPEATQTEITAFNNDLNVDPEKIVMPRNFPRTTGNVRSHKVKQTFALGHPVGIMLGSFNKHDNNFDKLSRSLQGIACAYTAFAMTFIQEETDWTRQVVNAIIIEGNRLYLTSTDDGKNPDNPILRKFEINEVSVEVSHYDADIIGSIESYDITVCSLYHGLKMFFKFHQFGIFESGKSQLLIWKKNAFFVFDSNGRTQHAELCNESGSAALITLVHLENLVYFIAKMSDLTSRSVYRICPLKMAKLYQLPEPTNEKVKKKPPISRLNEFSVLNNQHAILYGKYHIGDALFGDHRNKQSLAVSIAGIVYSKIDPPNTWNRKTLHKVLLFGDQLYTTCIKKHCKPILISLRDVPAIFRLGMYETKICITPFIFNCPIRHNNIRDATKFLKHYFTSSRYVLVQIRSGAFAVWTRNDFYYLLDPFNRSKTGEVGTTKCGAACLHIFSRLYELCQVLFKMLIKIAADENCYIHSLKIVYLNERKESKVKKCKGKDKGKEKPNSNFECMLESDDEGEEDFEVPLFATEPNDENPDTIPEIQSLEDSINEYLLERKNCHDRPVPVPYYYNLNELALAESQYPNPYPIIRKEFFEPVAKDGTYIMTDTESSDISFEGFGVVSFLSCTDPTEKRKLEMAQYKPKKTSQTTIAICADMVEEIFDAFNEQIAECEYEYDESGNVLKKLSPLLPPKSKKILIKSDLDYLTAMKERTLYLKDSEKSQKPIRPKKLTLAEEMQIPSNFVNMPDHSQLLFGTKSIHDIEFPYGIDQMNALVGIAALISSHKYSIASWDSSIVNFTIDVSSTIGEQLPVNQSILYSSPRFHFGNVQIGSNVYTITLKNIATGLFGNLYRILEKIFETYDRVVVITTCDSFSVFKRYNFYYLYEGYPCDVVGFRTTNLENGKACFMRFLSLTALVRRIESNRLQCTMNHRIGISCIIMNEVKGELLKQYMRRTESMEQLMMKQIQDERTKKRQAKIKKLKLYNEEIKKEKARVKQFKREKRRVERLRAKRDAARARLESEGENYGEEQEYYSYFDDDDDDAECESSDESDEDECEDNIEEDLEKLVESSDEETRKYPKKHELGANLIETGDPVYKDQVDCNIERNYKKYSDNFYRIQGSFALADRGEIVPREYKNCFYVGIYALIYIIHHPIYTLNYRKIDIILENGISLSENITCKKVNDKIEIRKVLVDKYNYHLIIKKFEIINPFSRLSLEIALDTYFQKKKYIILYFENCSFVIYKDEMYHLFDPYQSREIFEVKTNREYLVADDLDDQKDEGEEKVYDDQNTASWILFSGLTPMISYILKRLVRSEDLNKNYTLYSVFIQKYELAPKKSLFAQFLMNETLPGNEMSMKCPVEHNIINVEPEKILWIENVTMLPWNRIQSRNIIGNNRKTPQTMYKEFDIEMPYELYSLWSTLHPTSLIFSRKSRGKQYLAVSVISCLMAHLYKLNDWNSELMDEIIVKGDTYFLESTADINVQDYELSLEDLNPNFLFGTFYFNISIQAVVVGILYDTRLDEFNLSRALTYFFEGHRYGILQCNKYVLALGKGSFGFFMYDCQSFGAPIFTRGTGTAYVLKCSSLKRLLHSIILTLHVLSHRVQFSIHSVDMSISRDFETSKGQTDAGFNYMLSAMASAARTHNICGDGSAGGGGAAGGKAGSSASDKAGGAQDDNVDDDSQVDDIGSDYLQSPDANTSSSAFDTKACMSELDEEIKRMKKNNNQLASSDLGESTDKKNLNNKSKKKKELQPKDPTSIANKDNANALNVKDASKTTQPSSNKDDAKGGKQLAANAEASALANPTVNFAAANATKALKTSLIIPKEQNKMNNSLKPTKDLKALSNERDANNAGINQTSKPTDNASAPADKSAQAGSGINSNKESTNATSNATAPTGQNAQEANSSASPNAEDGLANKSNLNPNAEDGIAKTSNLTDGKNTETFEGTLELPAAASLGKTKTSGFPLDPLIDPSSSAGQQKDTNKGKTNDADNKTGVDASKTSGANYVDSALKANATNKTINKEADSQDKDKNKGKANDLASSNNIIDTNKPSSFPRTSFAPDDDDDETSALKKSVSDKGTGLKVFPDYSQRSTFPRASFGPAEDDIDSIFNRITANGKARTASPSDYTLSKNNEESADKPRHKEPRYEYPPLISEKVKQLSKSLGCDCDSRAELIKESPFPKKSLARDDAKASTYNAQNKVDGKKTSSTSEERYNAILNDCNCNTSKEKQASTSKFTSSGLKNNVVSSVDKNQDRFLSKSAAGKDLIIPSSKLRGSPSHGSRTNSAEEQRRRMLTKETLAQVRNKDKEGDLGTHSTVMRDSDDDDPSLTSLFVIIKNEDKK